MQQLIRSRCTQGPCLQQSIIPAPLEEYRSVCQHVPRYGSRELPHLVQRHRCNDLLLLRNRHLQRTGFLESRKASQIHQLQILWPTEVLYQFLFLFCFFDKLKKRVMWLALNIGERSRHWITYSLENQANWLSLIK